MPRARSQSSLILPNGFNKPTRPVLIRDHASKHGLTGLWPLGDKAGAGVAQDIAGGHNSVLKNSPTLVASHHGGLATSFTSASAQFATIASFPYLPEFWLSLWVNRQGGGGLNFQSIAAHWTSSPSAGDWYLYWNASNRLNVDIPFVLGNVVAGTSVIATSGWHHVVLARTGSTGSWKYSIYFDGKFDASATTASNPATGALALNFNNDNITAASHVATQSLEGIRIEPGRITPQQVAQLYAEPYIGIADAWQMYEIRSIAAASTGSSATISADEASDNADVELSARIQASISSDEAADASDVELILPISASISSGESADNLALSLSDIPGLTLDLTEANDSADVELRVPTQASIATDENGDGFAATLILRDALTIALTEGADNAAGQLQANQSLDFPLTEANDNAAGQLNVVDNATLDLSEDPDVSNISLHGPGFSIDTQEGNDTAGIELKVVDSTAFTATEANDNAALSLTANLALTADDQEAPDSSDISIHIPDNATIVIDEAGDASAIMATTGGHHVVIDLRYYVRPQPRLRSVRPEARNRTVRPMREAA